MSKPRYKWWTYAKAVVRSYPELKREYNAIRSQRISANLSNMPAGKGLVRGAEITALKQLPPARQREYDAVAKAIDITKRYKNGDERLKIIDLVYWKKSHNVAGAALEVGYSDARGKQLHGEFIRLVGFCMGLEDAEAS